MPTPAQVVVLPKDPGPLEIIDLQLPDPDDHQVVVKQYASGICHSQLHQMHAQRKQPVVLGHESTGVVVAKGKDVKHVKDGDRVMVTWVPRNAAKAKRLPPAASITLPDGATAVSQNVFTWADYTIADEQYVVKGKKDMRTDVTAIIGCAVMTGAGAVTNTADVKPGNSVAIFGAGGVGLSAIVAAKVRGADPIIAVDVDDAKLAFARKFGATHVVNASKEDPVAAVHRMTGRSDAYTFLHQPVSGADFVFDCIGLRQTMEQIGPAAKTGQFGVAKGGMAILVGVPTTPVELSAVDMLLNEKQFVGSLGGSCVPEKNFADYLDWFDRGALDLDSMVTARYTIDRINEATEALEKGRIEGRAILEFENV